MSIEPQASETRPPRVLVVEDSEEMWQLLRDACADEGWSLTFAATGEQALAQIAAECDCLDLVVADVHLPGMSGVDVLRFCHARDPALPVIMLTATQTAESIVECMKAGAADYLVKPCRLAEFVQHVRQALESRRNLLRRCPRPGADEYLASVMGPSREVKGLAQMVAQVSPTNMSVLIEGESGTGKEIIAQRVHALSSRKDGPFVAVDSGAIPEALLEGELFGFKKGSFTGAYADREGKIQAADGGTLFLDELENLPLSIQVKLLRVLQEKQVTPLGVNRPVPVNVRLIGTSNCPLRERVAQGAFRQDLFYRVAEFRIHIPPLRERIEDLLHLCVRFLHEASEEFGKPVDGFSDEALEQILSYPWPGNVRELRSALRRAVLLHSGPGELHWDGVGDAAEATETASRVSVTEVGDKIVVRALAVVGHAAIRREQVPFKEIHRRLVRGVEDGLLSSILRQVGGNKSRLARILNLDYKTVHSKAKNLGTAKEEPA